MKRSILVLAVALACLVVAPVAFAQSRVACDSGGGATFVASGTVAAVDTVNSLLSVTVTKGSDGLPSPLPVAITDATQIVAGWPFASEGKLVRSLNCGRSTIALDQVVVGEQVNVRGMVDASSGTAVYDAALVCVSQPRFFCEGAVSAVDTANNLLTVDVAHASAGLSGSVQLAIIPATRMFSFADFDCTHLDLSQVVLGDQVAVCGAIDTSSATPVYDARIVFDCGTVALPAPTSKPTSFSMKARGVARGKFLKVHLRVRDAMPGCSAARVSFAVLNAKGTRVAAHTVSGVALNKVVTLTVKLHKGLTRGTYRLVTKATDEAGNHQLRVGSAVLRVR